MRGQHCTLSLKITFVLFVWTHQVSYWHHAIKITGVHAARTYRLNKNMYILSVISAIFLPLGFLTGLLGINVGGIPGAENVDAFWIFSGGLVTLVIGLLSLFKVLKWF